MSKKNTLTRLPKLKEKNRILFKIRLFFAGLVGVALTSIGFYLLLVLTDSVVSFTGNLRFLHINTIIQIIIGIIQMFVLFFLGDIVGKCVSIFTKNRLGNLGKKVAVGSYIFGCFIAVFIYFNNIKVDNLPMNLSSRLVNIILSLIPSILLALKNGNAEPLYTWILIIPRVLGMLVGYRVHISHF